VSVDADVLRNDIEQLQKMIESARREGLQDSHPQLFQALAEVLGDRREQLDALERSA
jgi:hypothetical protein